jgi:hypothetical protein
MLQHVPTVAQVSGKIPVGIEQWGLQADRDDQEKQREYDCRDRRGGDSRQSLLHGGFLVTGSSRM